jgi:hypothetical protein
MSTMLDVGITLFSLSNIDNTILPLMESKWKIFLLNKKNFN